MNNYSGDWEDHATSGSLEVFLAKFREWLEYEKEKANLLENDLEKSEKDKAQKQGLVDKTMRHGQK